MLNFFLKRFLTKLLSKPCPRSIPSRGDEASKVDCMICYLEGQEDDTYYIIKKYTDDVITLEKYVNKNYQVDIQITLDEIRNYKILIIHFLGRITISFTSIGDYFFHYITKFIYIKTFIIRLYDSLFQWLFNIKKLDIKDRIQILEFMKNEHIINNTFNGINDVRIGEKLYSERFYGREDYEEVLRELKLNLDSLAYNQDLIVKERKYYIGPNALKTLDSYQLEQRKHAANIGMQKKMFYLSIIMAIFGFVEFLNPFLEKLLSNLSFE